MNCLFLSSILHKFDSCYLLPHGCSKYIWLGSACNSPWRRYCCQYSQFTGEILNDLQRVQPLNKWDGRFWLEISALEAELNNTIIISVLSFCSLSEYHYNRRPAHWFIIPDIKSRCKQQYDFFFIYSLAFLPIYRQNKLVCLFLSA